MLPPAVYREIYSIAYDAPDLDILEVGGAAGAASIALAMGLQDSGKRSGVVVVEKLEGGSRTRFGDYATNLTIIERNFRAFGVEKTIRLFPHQLTFDNATAVKALIKSNYLAALVLDADGNLDRDFSLFWPLLIPNGSIVIDDYLNDSSRFTEQSLDKPAGGIKHVLTFRLTNYFIERGVLLVKHQIGSTLFCTKPPGGRVADIDLDECQRIRKDVERERDAVIRGARWNNS